MKEYEKNREKSKFYNMQRFHNDIKRKLINKYGSECSNLIDLGCGKGGDIHKWIDNNIKKVIGYDINEDYLKEARKRFDNIKKEKNTNIEIDFQKIDLTKNVIPTESVKSDIITANFCLHYFFKDRKTFNILKKSVTNNLKNGGYFIGTIFDGKSLSHILNDNNNMQFNDLFKIKKVNIENKTFGDEIEVYLKDTIIENISNEYLIYFGKFLVEMEKSDYILVDTKMFYEEISNYKNKLQDHEKKFSYLNRYFVFKKV